VSYLYVQAGQRHTLSMNVLAAVRFFPQSPQVGAFALAITIHSGHCISLQGANALHDRVMLPPDASVLVTEQPASERPRDPHQPYSLASRGQVSCGAALDLPFFKDGRAALTHRASRVASAPLRDSAHAGKQAVREARYPLRGLRRFSSAAPLSLAPSAWRAR
jgi:hypothetical protein